MRSGHGKGLPRRSAAGAKAGFTLIEVLVALVVAVAAMTIISQGFTAGARGSMVSQNATRAAVLAGQVITDYETGELTASQTDSRTFPEAPEFTAETFVEAADPGLVRLSVTVTWQEQGQPRTYILTRLLRDRTGQPQ